MTLDLSESSFGSLMLCCWIAAIGVEVGLRLVISAFYIGTYWVLQKLLNLLVSGCWIVIIGTAIVFSIGDNSFDIHSGIVEICLGLLLLGY